jgi:UDP-glucuronate 4-epimerase
MTAKRPARAGEDRLAILVTGGAGFIGSHLVGRLLRDGRGVVVLDNLNDYYDPSIKRRNIEEIRYTFPKGELEVVEADLRDAAALRELLVGHRFQLVYHLAAMAGVRASIVNPILYFDVNVQGTMNLLEAALDGGRPPFVYASSSSVYGGSPRIPFREDDPVNEPISPYAASKKAAELVCHTYHHLYGLDITCLRFFTVYGPRQRPEMAIHRFARRMAEGRPVPMFGDGGTSRDYTYIDDIIEGVVAAGQRCGGYKTYNLGNSHPVELRELIDRLAMVMKITPEIDRQPQPPGDVERTWADISLARKELGYDPQTDLNEGLRRFVEWFRKQ